MENIVITAIQCYTTYRINIKVAILTEMLTTSNDCKLTTTAAVSPIFWEYTHIKKKKNMIILVL